MKSIVIAGLIGGTMAASSLAHADLAVQRAAFAALDGEYGTQLRIYGEKWNVYRAQVTPIPGGIEVKGEMDKERDNWWDDGIDYKIRIVNGDVQEFDFDYDDNDFGHVLLTTIGFTYRWCTDHADACRRVIDGLGSAVLALETDGASDEEAARWARLQAWAANLPEGDDKEEAYKIAAHIAVEAYRRTLVSPLMYGVDLPGSDMEVRDMLDHEGPLDCRLACAGWPDCTSFSYVPRMSRESGALCWLKNGRPAEVPANTRDFYIISGRVR